MALVAAGTAVALAALILGAIVGGGRDDVSPAVLATPTSAVEEQPPSTTETEPVAPGTIDFTPETVAEGYAIGRSGGVRTGCSRAAPGAEAEQNAGCAFFVAFTGCMEGQTGKQFGPLAVSEEFPTEPALVALHQRAVEDCAG